MKRRVFLSGLLAIGATGIAGTAMGLDVFKKKDKKKDKQVSDQKVAKDKPNNFPFQLSDAEWKERLTPEQYRVLRKAGTERSGSSPLDQEKREGVFHCAGCDHPLFLSAHKFDSGTGWPSFYQPINDQALGFTTDYVLLYPRTEEHCANCGGHLGHVFKDGPPPTGKRHCINGVALNFKPTEA